MSLKNNAYAFISYIRDDKNRVDQLKEHLVDAGIKVWIDRNELIPGMFWKEAIHQSIINGTFFIACFSLLYYKREKTYMNDEIQIAIDTMNQLKKMRFIPVKLSKCDIPAFSVGHNKTLLDIQSVDLYNDWHKGVRNILSAIVHQSQSPVNGNENSQKNRSSVYIKTGNISIGNVNNVGEFNVSSNISY